MAQNLTLDKEQVDLGDDASVLYYFTGNASRSRHPLYVTTMLVAGALRLMSPAQRRKLIPILEDAKQMSREHCRGFGEQLPNGATVIERKQMAGERHEIVLARTNSGTSRYATWEEYHHDGLKPATGAGHYFDNIADAAADFAKR